MPVYKIFKTYMVSASSKIEARNVFTTAVAQNKEDEFLESVRITETDQPKTNGWGSTLKQQLVGSTKQ